MQLLLCIATKGHYWTGLFKENLTNISEKLTSQTLIYSFDLQNLDIPPSLPLLLPSLLLTPTSLFLTFYLVTFWDSLRKRKQGFLRSPEITKKRKMETRHYKFFYLQWKQWLEKISLFHCFCRAAGSKHFLKGKPVFQTQMKSNVLKSFQQETACFQLTCPSFNQVIALSYSKEVSGFGTKLSFFFSFRNHIYVRFVVVWVFF